MTNDGLSLQIHVPFFFIVKTEQKSVRPMEKAGKKFGKVYLTSKAAAEHTLCCSPATLIQLSVTCLFCSLELLRRRAAWENGGNNRFSKRRFSLRFDAYFHEQNQYSFILYLKYNPPMGEIHDSWVHKKVKVPKIHFRDFVLHFKAIFFLISCFLDTV